MSAVFWDITYNSPLRNNRHFGGTYLLQFKGRIVSHYRNQHEARSKQSLEGAGDTFLENLG